jgi:dinuclear metal center YbgI/SA1388 family protein
MVTTVADMIGLMEHLAPARLAEEWDPVGLQVGRPDWPVERVWVALDPLPSVISAACRENVDLLVTHHPLVFSPLRNLDCSRYPGTALCLALENRLAVFSAHTNYDSAPRGLNDLLAERLGLKALRPLQAAGSDAIKLVAVVPSHCEGPALNRLLAAGADRTASRRFDPHSVRLLTDATPNVESRDAEAPFRGIEAVIAPDRLHQAVNHLRNLAGCEDVPVEVLPPESPGAAGNSGLGRIGILQSPRPLDELARRVKRKLHAGYVRICGNPDMTVERVAICSGSGSGLLNSFLASDAQVFITGDFKYHDARIIEFAGRGLIDAGHFATEHIMVTSLAQRLDRRAKSAGLSVSVQACELETDVFTAL